MNTVQFPYLLSVLLHNRYSSYDLSHTNFQQRAFGHLIQSLGSIIIRSEEEAQTENGSIFRR